MSKIQIPRKYCSRDIVKSVFAIAFLAVAASCATLPEDDSLQNTAWPGDIPPRTYFIDAFKADVDNQTVQQQRDYLTWILRFYQGWALYPRGWNWLTEEVVESVELEDRQIMSSQMYSLGERISAEWAKNRDYRTVNTNHLMIWGDALKIAIREGSQAELANKISSDVDGLLRESIDPGRIDLDRYLDGGAEVASEDGEEADFFDDPVADDEFLEPS